MRLFTGRPVINQPHPDRWTPPTPPSDRPTTTIPTPPGTSRLTTGTTLIRYPKSGAPGPAPCVDLVVGDPTVDNEDQATAWPDYASVPSPGYSTTGAVPLSPTMRIASDPDTILTAWDTIVTDTDSLFWQKPASETLSGQGCWALTTDTPNTGAYCFRALNEGPIGVGLTHYTPHLIPIAHRLCANGGRVTAVVEEGSEVGVRFDWKAPSGRIASIRYWFVDADYDPINATYQPTGFLDTIGNAFYETVTTNFLGTGGAWASFDVSTVRGTLPAPAGAVGVCVGVAVRHPGTSANTTAYVYLDQIDITIT